MSGPRPFDLATSAYAVPGPSAQLKAVREAAHRVRRTLDGMPAVRAIWSFPRTTLPYPTKFAFGGAARVLTPMVSMLHRTLLVQYEESTGDGERRMRNLLFNPTDVERSRKTPYFARVIKRLGPLEPLVAQPFPGLLEQLASVGLAADDIDYLAFDHFHTQDLRALLGTSDGNLEPLFPNAELLAPAVEWDEWDDVHPLQRDFMIEDGKLGVRLDAVRRVAADLIVGPGVLLVRTPGHTCGNQTLFVKTTRGVWGVSENGTSADCWDPAESRISGLRKHALATGHEVILNSNTPESSATQYAAMVLEKTVVDRTSDGAVQMWPSSEVTPTLMVPGVKPSHVHGELRFGSLARPVELSRKGPVMHA